MTPSGFSSSPPPFGAPLFRILGNSDEPAAPSGMDSSLSPFASPSAPAAALTVADVLPQLPPDVARASAVPQDQPVQISPHILSHALSSGQLTVPLFEVYRVCPGIFLAPVSPDDARMVNLPAAKLPALVASASAASPSATQPPPSPFASLFTAAPAGPAPAASTIPSLLGQPAPVASESQPGPAPQKGATILPPRRDPSQAPASSLPPSPFLDSPAVPPLSASSPFTFPGSSEPVAPPPQELPQSLFSDASAASPFAAAPPVAGSPFDAPNASPFAFGAPSSEAPAPASSSPIRAVSPGSTKLSGPATASVAALLQGQSADVLGFDPAMVPSWITTQFHGGLVAELQDMPAPSMDLGSVVDGITDIGFRNVLNSARRGHSIPVPLHLLSPATPASPLTAATPAPAASPPPLRIPPHDSPEHPASPFPVPDVPNPFAPSSPAPADSARQTFRIEPGNPFSTVPDAPQPESTIPPSSPSQSPPLSAATPPALSPAAPPIQPSVDFESLFSAAKPAQQESPPSPPRPPQTPATPASAPAFDFTSKAFDPFAPAAPQSGGFSSFDLLGGDSAPEPPAPAEPPSPAPSLSFSTLPAVSVPSPLPSPEPVDETPAAIIPEIPITVEPAFVEPPITPAAATKAAPAASTWPDIEPVPPPSPPARPAPEPQAPAPAMPVFDFTAPEPPAASPAMPAFTSAPPRGGSHAKPTLGFSALEPSSSGDEQLLLRALLDTDEDLTLNQVIEMTGNLPGIASCALVRGSEVVAGSSNKGTDAKAFRAQAADLAKNLRSLAPLIGITDAETFTLNTDSRLITLCFPGDVTLAVLHDREPAMGLRDKLTLIARQLDHLIRKG